MNNKSLNSLKIFFFILSIIGFLYAQNNYLQVSNYIIVDNNIPDEFNGYKIVQISDYHNTKSNILNEKLVRQIKKVKPDMIVITGDLIDSTYLDIDVAINFIKKINAIAPIYYVTGNHETWINNYSSLKEELKKNNVKVLENEMITIKKKKSKINLIGIEDSVSERDFASKLLISNYSQDSYKILLSHRPELFNAYVNNNIDLVLTGHAHGGQLRVFNQGLIAPDQGLFPKYTSGIFTENNTKMIVSRGIGNSIIPLRLNNHPELVVINLNNQSK